MQPIHRASCPDPQESSAAYLAGLINENAEVPGASASGSGDCPHASVPRTHGQDENALIWVEIDTEHAPKPVAGDRRGLIIVAHCSGHRTTERLIVISFPVATDDGGQRVREISAILTTMGWTLRACRCGRTAGGYTNTAVLVTEDRHRLEQRLCLIEPVAATPDHDRLTPRRLKRRSDQPVAALATEERGKRVPAWMNEGKAGDDARSWPE